MRTSDLISRSELINVLKERATNESIAGYMTAYDVTNSIIDEVEEQPTAYDINKVVDELNCDRCESCSFLEVCAGSKCCTECHKKIIEIVKQGIVSDDVCEWRVVDIPYLPVYGTGCGKTRLQYSTGIDVYCNGCGKKIKVVN